MNRLNGEQLKALSESLSDSAKETIDYFGAGVTYDLELKVPQIDEDGDSYSAYWGVEVIKKLGTDLLEIAEVFEKGKRDEL